MHKYSSYIPGKTLESDGFKNSENRAMAVITDLSTERFDQKFYDKLLTANKDKQEKLGQFHTPEVIVNVVLNSLPSKFEEMLLSGASILDPSCGTGNFFIAVIKRVMNFLEKNGERNPFNLVNEKIIPNMVGVEIDPLMRTAVQKIFEFEFDGKINVPRICIFDALTKSKGSDELLGKFDFVVGNPPWVEVKELPDQIKDFVQDRYEVSNLYGAFIIRGIEFLRKGGFLSYVVPRSFTGGRYYSKLRAYINSSTSIQKVSYIKNRDQDFHGGKVLQETVVLSLQNRKNQDSHKVKCCPMEDFSESLSSFEINQNDLFSRHDLIMLLADSEAQFSWLEKIGKLKNFEQHGFRMSTGQLVLHRAKDFLRENFEDGASRVIYTHDIINENGIFSFQQEIRTVKDRKPYAVSIGRKNYDGRNRTKDFDDNKSCINSYRNTFNEVIIFRRRSHKGDLRRFVGLYLRDELPKEYFLENGINFIVAESFMSSSPSLKSLSRILRSDLFEQFFEIISSNTQINKNDMYLLGIPDLTNETRNLYSKIESLDINDLDSINKAVRKLYDRALEDGM